MGVIGCRFFYCSLWVLCSNYIMVNYLNIYILIIHLFFMAKNQVYEVLLQGLETISGREEFQERVDKVEDAATDRIIQDTKSQKITWRRDLGRSVLGEEYFTAKVTVQNGRGEEIQLPATISYKSSYTDDTGFLDEYVELSLGDNEDICLASIRDNSSFKEIAENIFKLPPKKR